MLHQTRNIKGGNMNSKVYVANLPPQATEPEIKDFFSKAGNVMSVKIVQDRQTGQPRGIAFVEMSTQWEGRRAVSMLTQLPHLISICWQIQVILRRKRVISPMISRGEFFSDQNSD